MTLPILNLKTEFTFKGCFGPLQATIEEINNRFAGNEPEKAVAIADRNGTWSHAPFAKACHKLGIKPVFGVELFVAADITNRDKKEGKKGQWVVLLAKNDDGLREIYQITSEATKPENFFFQPRISIEHLKGLSSSVATIVAPKGFVIDPDPTPKGFDCEVLIGLGPGYKAAKKQALPAVPLVDNRYLMPSNRPEYDALAGGGREHLPHSQHLITLGEWLAVAGNDQAVVDMGWQLLKECNASLPAAEMVRPPRPSSLASLCAVEAMARGIDLEHEEYQQRLQRELTLIEQKGFTDYFFCIWELVKFAKERMLVGPARGSSCGSLACYCLGITEVDPIKHKLLFERFIDINRNDFPDIDIDFPDDQRELVFQHLAETYGSECVARLGTISRLKPKSAIVDVCRSHKIDAPEIEEFKNSIEVRASGDGRSNKAIEDELKTPLGQKVLAKFPQLRIAANLEGHARHTGQHAAAVVVANKPINNFCSTDHQTGSAMVDKDDAEALGMLKIDALGLRTLAVLGEACAMTGTKHEGLFRLPIDDHKTFDQINQGNFAGVFQFEGGALQSLCKQVVVDSFDDLCSITSLCRPGPLDSGAAERFAKLKQGKAQVDFIHPMLQPITQETFGLVVYQEQVMSIARIVGNMDWPTVTRLRKAIAKSQGREAVEGFRIEFMDGAKANGLSELQAQQVWKQIETMGSYSFNKSHAVAYSYISYWCLWFKAHHPLEFAAATLRHAKDDAQARAILRELTQLGRPWEPFNFHLSELNWEVKQGALYGGFSGLKGVGPKTAQNIIEKRNKGLALMPGERKRVDQAECPWGKANECHELFAPLFDYPERFAHIVASKIQQAGGFDWLKNEKKQALFLAKLVDVELKDANSPGAVAKRGNKVQGQSKYLILSMEDDSGAMKALVNREAYPKHKTLGHQKGQWFLVKGTVGGDCFLFVERIKGIKPEDLAPPEK